MKENIHLNYLLSNENDTSWGLTVNTVGFQQIDKNAHYPPRIHPASHLFSTDRGRELNEYQLVYLTRGRGLFSNRTQRNQELLEGTMLLLFPAEWHSYSPDPSTGWDEYWIGFNGVNMDQRVQQGFFQAHKSVYKVGIQEEIVHIYRQAIDIAQAQPTGFQPLLAGLVNHILGVVYSHDKQLSFDQLNVRNQLERAKLLMRENFNRNISPETIAEQLCMSYSRFRRVFRDYTGFAPAQYMQELKLQKAKELLTFSELSVQEISYEIGLENTDHFSTFFRKRTGIRPLRYRAQTRRM